MWGYNTLMLHNGIKTIIKELKLLKQGLC